VRGSHAPPPFAIARRAQAPFERRTDSKRVATLYAAVPISSEGPRVVDVVDVFDIAAGGNLRVDVNPFQLLPAVAARGAPLTPWSRRPGRRR
jgi:hypothetical protein